jgi:pimeloyl-ACP methyl ester carboxylesterase
MEAGGPSSPPIPHRNLQTPKSSRRRRPSTAKSTTEPSPSSRSTKSQPPSPEVISSLISSLAAISTPAENHFDQLPRIGSNTSESSSLTLGYRTSSRSTPADRVTNAREHSRSPQLREGFGVDYGAYTQPEEEDHDSYLIANTAYAPIIRMSKQRAGSSSSRSQTPTLKGSQQSLQSRDETASIGRLSSEPGLQPSSANTAPTKSSGIARLIGRKISKEVVSNGHSSERSNSTARGAGEGLSPLGNGLRLSNSRASFKEDKIEESAVEWQSSPVSPQTPSRAGPSILTLTDTRNSRSAEHFGGIGSGRMIPSRQSSLHYTTTNSPVKMSSKSLRHSRGSKDLRIGQEVLEEEDSTVRRIRELQRQKEKREREQKREERRAEKKRSRNSMPGPAPPERTTSNQSSRHSMAEMKSRVPDQPALFEDDAAPPPAISTYTNRRVSVGQLPCTATYIPGPRSGSVVPEMLPSLGSRPVTPMAHQRALSDPQLSPGRGSLAIDRPRSADSIDDAVESYLAAPRLTQRVRHPESGRVIAFSEVGHPHGFPVICCVGMGMTRYIMAFYDELALTLRLRLITIDRPGVGESDQYSSGNGVPLNWPDDVSIVCNALSIVKFSLLAHSAGAIYALATALRLPQQVRGRLHLMAPWIPPSQMSSIGSQKDAVPSSSIPYSQKLLRVLPASFLRAANSSFMSSTTSSIIPKSPRRSKRKSVILGNGTVDLRPPSSNGIFPDRYPTLQPVFGSNASTSDLTGTTFRPQSRGVRDDAASRMSTTNLDENLIRARQYAYDTHLTQRIWDLAQRNANPAVDLLVCLERGKTIGFRYVDITRACVFHHGSRDTRVPVENVRWLARKMRRCEVRVLEGEGHSLMASAKIMAEVLTDVAREWEDWARVTREGRGRRVFADQFDD